MQTVPDATPIPSSTGNLQTGQNEPVPNPAPAPRQKAAGLGLWLRDLFVSAAASELIIAFLYQPVRG